MESIKIRMATMSDCIDIMSLVNLAYRSKDIQGWTSEAEIIDGNRIHLAQVEELIESKKSFMFLAFEEQILVGCVHLKLEKHVGYIGLLTTHPKIQNLGLGKILLQFAEDYCVEQYRLYEFEISVLSIRKELIEFYERRAYVFTGQVDSYPIDTHVGKPLSLDIQVLHFKKIRK